MTCNHPNIKEENQASNLYKLMTNFAMELIYETCMLFEQILKYQMSFKKVNYLLRSGKVEPKHPSIQRNNNNSHI